MKKVDFLAKVKEEANQLKNALTNEQKEKIDFKTLKPTSPTLCLLAQIFGRHDSVDSLNVFPKSIFAGVELDFMEEIYISSKQKPNIRFERFEISEVKSENLAHTTYLETFLVCDVNTEDLVKFVKGEIDVFEPSFNEVAEAVE